MIVIGEKINATRKKIAAALEARDKDHIVHTALEQVKAGAHYIDLNGGDPRAGKEANNMAWLMEVVQEKTETPVAIDTADPNAAKVGLSLAEQRPIMNSVSLETERLEKLLPITADYDCMVVALLMSDDGPPKGVDDRLKSAGELIEKIVGTGKKVDDIIVDPCFFPVSADTDNGRILIDSIAAIHKEWPEVHIGGGCSNVSYGLPKRRYVNLALIAQAIYAGMDAGIIDPTVPEIVPMIMAAEAVAGFDDFCMNYVTAEREGKLE